MRYILFIYVLCVSGCGEVRDFKAEYEKLAQQQTDVVKVADNARAEAKQAESKLSASDKLRLAAQKEAEQAKFDMKAADALEKAEVLNEAKQWRKLFDIIGTVLVALGTALLIVCFIQQWPLKWLAYILGCSGIGLYTAGAFYVYVVEYRAWVIGVTVAVVLGALYWVVHCKSSFISQTKDDLHIREDQIKGTAKQVLKSWKIPTGYDSTRQKLKVIGEALEKSTKTVEDATTSILRKDT